MIRRTSAAALFALTALALGACKGKEPEPEAVPVPSGTPAAVTADPAPTGAAPTGDAPMGDAADGGADASAATPTPQAAGGSDAPTPKTGGGGGSIDACCSALDKLRQSKNPNVKPKAAAAYSVCGGIAQRVKSGETSRSAALTQIRSAMVGTDVPGECR
jgi:hypothetical protein